MNENVEANMTLNCRICRNTNSDNCIDLNNESWLEIYNYCIQTVDVITHPTKICWSCAQQLQDYAKFKKQCFDSDEYWQECKDALPEVKPEVENVYNEENYEWLDDDQDSLLILVGKDEDNLLEDNKISLLNEENRTTHCIYCFKQYKRETSLKKHMLKCTSRKEKDDAPEENTEIKEEITKHAKEPNKNSNSSDTELCGICDTKCEDTAELRNHLLDHFVSKSLKCMLCHYKGRDFADMIHHRYTHLPVDISSRKIKVTCICELIKYSTPMRLEYHFRKVHLQKEKPGWCRYCNKEYRCFKMWRYHQSLHVTEGYQCDYCGCRFFLKYSLINHIKLHQNIRPYMCDICGMSFSRLRQIRLHKENKHVDRKPLKCNHCNKMFRSQERIDIHMRRATMPKKFECEICSKKFILLSCLNIHRKMHLDDMPFKCEVCFKLFKRKSSLRSHMVVHQSFAPHKCSECDRPFKTKRSLKRHVDIVHHGINFYKCLHCPASYNCKRTLVNHNRKCHDDVS